MKKIVKKWGDSIIIRFSPEETKIFDLKEGDIIIIDDEEFAKLNKKQMKNEKNTH